MGGFNQDYYPPFIANEPANQAEPWLAGTDVPPKTMQLTGENKKGKAANKGGLSRLKTGVKATAASEESKGGEDTAALLAQIASLKNQLAAAQSSSTGEATASNEDLSTVPELGYWAIRGLAAQIRMMFYYLNVNFIDKQYPCGDAPDFDRSSWFDVKFSLGMEYPNLPYLLDGDAKITETTAIMQYIAKKYRPELLGSTAAELGRVNMLAAQVHDLKMKATMPCYVTGDVDAIIEECRPLLA